MLLRLSIVSGDRRRKILFLGSVRFRRVLIASNEERTTDGERAARFEKVPGGDVVNFQDVRRVLIAPREVVRFTVGEEIYREGLLNLVDFSNFSKQVVLYSGLIRKLVRCRDDISLCESGDVDLVPTALRLGRWSDNQPRDTRRWEGEEELRLCVLRRTLVNCGVTLGDGVVTVEDAFTR